MTAIGGWSTADVTALFSIEGAVLSIEPFGNGHINDTFLATFLAASGIEQRVVLQRINTHVFPDPVSLMGNFCAVTDHLREQLLQAGAADIERRVLRHVPAKNGEPYAILPNGDFWRATYYIEDSFTVDGVENEQQLFMAGQAFGAFQNKLADLATPLTETIVDFHHTPKRFAALQAAVKNNVAGRVAAVRPELTFAFDREAFASTLVTLNEQGLIPTRTIHNDTKINNVLFDAISGEALCMTDLDTVMPGLAGYDFGELVRSGVSDSAEDELELARVQVDFGRFEQIAAGYLSATREMLTAAEREHLVTAAQMMTLENGIRFLADYLQGDVYFKTIRPNQNLDRCRVQFKLLQSLEDNAEALQKIVVSL